MRPATLIQRTNRRERGGRSVDLGTVALHIAAGLLTLVGFFRRPRRAPASPERLSVTQERLYRAWARGEAEG